MRGSWEVCNSRACMGRATSPSMGQDCHTGAGQERRPPMDQGGILHRHGRQGEELEPRPWYCHRRLLEAVATMLQPTLAFASSCWPHPLLQTPPLTCPLYNRWTLHHWHLDSHLGWRQWMDFGLNCATWHLYLHLVNAPVFYSSSCFVLLCMLWWWLQYTSQNVSIIKLFSIKVSTFGYLRYSGVSIIWSPMGQL